MKMKLGQEVDKGKLIKLAESSDSDAKYQLGFLSGLLKGLF